MKYFHIRNLKSDISQETFPPSYQQMKLVVRADIKKDKRGKLEKDETLSPSLVSLTCLRMISKPKNVITLILVKFFFCVKHLIRIKIHVPVTRFIEGLYM